mgnify:FL=1
MNYTITKLLATTEFTTGGICDESDYFAQGWNQMVASFIQNLIIVAILIIVGIVVHKIAKKISDEKRGLSKRNYDPNDYIITTAQLFAKPTFNEEMAKKKHENNEYATKSDLQNDESAKTDIYTWRDVVSINDQIFCVEEKISGEFDAYSGYDIDKFLETVAKNHNVDVDDVKTYMMDQIEFDPTNLPYGAEECGCYINGVAEWTIEPTDRVHHKVADHKLDYDPANLILPKPMYDVYCNCCGYEFTSTESEPICPNCDCKYDETNTNMERTKVQSKPNQYDDILNVNAIELDQLDGVTYVCWEVYKLDDHSYISLEVHTDEHRILVFHENSVSNDNENITDELTYEQLSHLYQLVIKSLSNKR